MKKKLLQFEQSDSIKASVQKEEIIRIIRDQRLKRQAQELDFNTTFNLSEKMKRSHDITKPITFLVRKKIAKR